MKQNIFFIVGTGRCGTQMLRNVLNNWNEIVILPETHFIVNLYNKYQLKEIKVHQFLEVVDNTFGSNGEKWIKVILNTTNRKYNSYKSEFINYVKNENVNGNIKSFIHAFFEYLYGKNFMFGDKTPHYGLNLHIITKIWPKAKIIHLIRDGVDSSLSMLGHNGFVRAINGNIKIKDLNKISSTKKLSTFSLKKPKLEKALFFWKKIILEIDRNLLEVNKQNKLVIKYEDIVFFPTKSITKIAKFLNIQNDKRSLKKSITVPKPFADKTVNKKLSGDEYLFYFNKIKNVMIKFGYPYNAKIDRKFLDYFKEFYRGRYYYILFFKNLIKSLILAVLIKINIK